ncbi:D-arabinitol 2-dehydrogenase [Xylaria cf. heliscus]|nr:D-arabinitol 2-dehydrogenase [Xylaria cf. heliscus]
MLPALPMPADVGIPASMGTQKLETFQTHSSHSALFSLSNKTIAITGGGRGLGITLASAVLGAGGHVACLDILAEPEVTEWATLREMAEGFGLGLSYHRVDVTDEEALSRIFDKIDLRSSHLGAPFYGSIACAGIQQSVPAINYAKVDFDRIQHVNVTGTFLTAKHTARLLVKNGVCGSIVLIASMSGQIANRGLTCAAYNTSKAAVQQLCRSLAQEWGQYGIRINTLSPGYIRTNMTDELLATAPDLEKVWMAGALLNRLGVPEDFKAPAIFLLSSGSSFMTGADLRVDGGHCASA